MKRSITLTLNQELLNEANEYAKIKGLTLSTMIENYLKLLVLKQSNQNTKEIKISDFVKSLSLENGGISADFDYKTEYRNYIAEKYK